MYWKLFGDKATFAIEIGEFCDSTDDGLRRVDVWAAGRWLTCDCNSAFVPAFIGELSRAVGSLLSDPHASNIGRPHADLSPADNHRRLVADAKAGENRDYLGYRFMRWGPTADNVSMHLFREDGIAFLPFSFWRETHHDPSELGQVFVAQLPEWELARVLHDVAWAMEWVWAHRSRLPQYPPAH